jgi:dTDP-4-dehydrorhamnose reductase
VVNCAAYTAVDKAEANPELAYRLNVEAVHHLAQACKAVEAYLIHISTDYVFDGNACRPYSETSDVNPQSVYGETKRQGEISALNYANSMVIRTAWLYSNYGSNFVNTMLRLASERTELRVVYDQIGTPTNAADLAACILSIVDKVSRGQRNFVAGVFHYTNEGVCSWYDFALQIIQLGKLACRVQPIESADYPTPAARPAYSVLNKAKIKLVFGIEIPHWTESLAKLKVFAA